VHHICLTIAIYFLVYLLYSTIVSHKINDQDRMGTVLKEKLKGKFCYVQIRNGKIVSVHYSPTESEEIINIKRGITGAFQANFDYQETVEESDPGSTHVSHYKYVHMYIA